VKIHILGEEEARSSWISIIPIHIHYIFDLWIILWRWLCKLEEY